MLAQSAISRCLPSEISPSVTAPAVGMRRVMYLKVKRVLQVIAWLLARQARHDRCPAGELNHPKPAGFGQGVGSFADLRDSGHAVRTAAQVELAERADVA